MKKVLLIAAVALLGFSANAQVKLGLGVGYALPMGDIADITDGGLAVHFELGYGINESIDASILYQGAFLAGVSASESSDGISVTTEASAVAIGSYLLNGRYFFTTNKFKPYGSLGLGLATVVFSDFEDDGENLEDFGFEAKTSNFAFRPALGFKYGVLDMNVAYLSAGKINEGSVGDLTINLGLLFTFGGN